MGDTKTKYTDLELTIMVNHLYKMCSSKNEDQRDIARAPKGNQVWEELFRKQRRFGNRERCEHTVSSMTSKYRKCLDGRLHALRGMDPYKVLFIYKFHKTEFLRAELCKIQEKCSDFDITFSEGVVKSFRRINGADDEEEEVQDEEDEKSTVLHVSYESDDGDSRRNGRMNLTPVLRTAGGTKRDKRKVGETPAMIRRAGLLHAAYPDEPLLETPSARRVRGLTVAEAVAAAAAAADDAASPPCFTPTPRVAAKRAAALPQRVEPSTTRKRQAGSPPTTSKTSVKQRRTIWDSSDDEDKEEIRRISERHHRSRAAAGNKARAAAPTRFDGPSRMDQYVAARREEEQRNRRAREIKQEVDDGSDDDIVDITDEVVRKKKEKKRESREKQGKKCEPKKVKQEFEEEEELEETQVGPSVTPAAAHAAVWKERARRQKERELEEKEEREAMAARAAANAKEKARRQEEKEKEKKQEREAAAAAAVTLTRRYLGLVPDDDEDCVIIETRGATASGGGTADKMKEASSKAAATTSSVKATADAAELVKEHEMETEKRGVSFLVDSNGLDVVEVVEISPSGSQELSESLIESRSAEEQLASLQRLVMHNDGMDAAAVLAEVERLVKGRSSAKKPQPVHGPADDVAPDDVNEVVEKGRKQQQQQGDVHEETLDEEKLADEETEEEEGKKEKEIEIPKHFDIIRVPRVIRTNSLEKMLELVEPGLFNEDFENAIMNEAEQVYNTWDEEDDGDTNEKVIIERILSKMDKTIEDVLNEEDTFEIF